MIEEDLRQKKQLTFGFLVKSSEDLTTMTISCLPRHFLAQNRYNME